jgi:TPP-dependent pyruvate/acetoin dehydrogenase alpha subunit
MYMRESSASEQSSPANKTDPDMPPETLGSRSNEVVRILEMFRTMHLIRAFDHAAARAWHEGRVRGSVHQYIGEEAIAVGVCANLRRVDYLASYHRGHGHAIAKGADVTRMMKELFGRADGTCGGKGGSMHIADFSVGMIGANGVVADGVTIAVGAAQAVKLLGEDKIVAAFFGDGAINRGPLMEAFNWAVVYKLPVLFVCEDNGYAATVRTASVTAGPGIVARALSFGLRADTVNGNDVIAVDNMAEKLVSHIRAGEGPALLHATAHRWYGHYAHDKNLYRDPAELVRDRADDPIVRCSKWLAENGVVAEELKAVGLEAEAMIDGILAASDAAPWPAPQAAFTDIQDAGVMSWQK